MGKGLSRHWTQGNADSEMWETNKVSPVITLARPWGPEVGGWRLE